MRKTGGTAYPTSRDFCGQPVRLNLRLLLNYVVAEDESYFSHGSGLVLEVATFAEGIARRDAARVNPSKVSANKEASVLKGGRQSDRRARAARTEHQIDHIWIFGASRARDIFPAPCEREAVFEGATQQQRTAVWSTRPSRLGKEEDSERHSTPEAQRYVKTKWPAFRPFPQRVPVSLLRTDNRCGYRSVDIWVRPGHLRVSCAIGERKFANIPVRLRTPGPTLHAGDARA